MTIRTLIFDLDGTLLNRQGQLSPLTQKVLNRLWHQGLTFVYATGRSPQMASLIENLLPGYFLCNNGAQIYRPPAVQNGRFAPTAEYLIDQQSLDPEISRQLIALARQHRLHLECNYGVHTVYEYIEREKVALYGNPILEINAQQSSWEQLDLRHCIKFATMGEEKELQPFLQELERRCPKQLHYGYSYPGYLEIGSPKLNKAGRLAALMQTTGQTLAQSMAFGDGSNDQQLLDQSTVAVVMSNAHPDLRQRAHFHLAPHHDQDGVAHFLRCWYHLEEVSGEN